MIVAGLMPLRSAFETPEAKRRYNARLFGQIAPRYDLATVVLSYGRDRHWKRRLVELADVAEGERALDLACGTADIALLLAARGARVTGLDLAPPMLALARGKLDGAPVRLAAGDMTRLPFATGCADVVTAGYGLRNMPALDVALGEVVRVLKPGGRFLALDFNKPDGWAMREAYLAYLSIVGSVLGVVFHGDGATYRYIAASLRRYPGAAAVCEAMTRAGFRDARWLPVLGGLMAIHVAKK